MCVPAAQSAFTSTMNNTSASPQARIFASIASGVGGLFNTARDISAQKRIAKLGNTTAGTSSNASFGKIG